MATVEELVNRLTDLEQNYRPSGEVTEHIKLVSAVLLMGAVGVGKSTVIKHVAELDSEFSNPGGLTTRESRSTDAKTYRHIPHTPQGLTSILDQVEAGDLVQYKVHPSLKNVYGSEASDYTTPFTILDTMASAVDQIRGAGFKKVSEIALVTNPAQYVVQLVQRYGKGIYSWNVKNRLKESEDSLV
ncbi:hypothetical protein KW794_01110 [Candidatus Saccharibacteria bacterium]|nr:hypothetical protein [Candidatus Saccharibacteria bacterium]